MHPLIPVKQCLYTPKNLSLPTYEQSACSSDPTDEKECYSCACEEPLENLAEAEFAREVQLATWKEGEDAHDFPTETSRVKSLYASTTLNERGVL
jgi:hypothetical protein